MQAQDFTDQVCALRPFLERAARQRLHNDAWAEDAVSETIIAALENPAAYSGRASVRTWLVGILKYKSVDQIRRNTRERQVQVWDYESESDDPTDASSDGFEAQAAWGDPHEQLHQRQFMGQFHRCLNALPARQARAFVLRYWMEEESADICTDLGVTAVNLDVILHRARNRLRVSLRANWISASAAVQTPPVS